MNFSIYIYFVAFYDEALTCQKVVVRPGRDDQGEGEEGGGGAQHRDTVLLLSRVTLSGPSQRLPWHHRWARVGEAVTMTETAAADGESERDLNNLCSVSGLMIRLAAATSGHSLVVTMAHCTPQPCNV